MTALAPLRLDECIECLIRLSEHPNYQRQTMIMFDCTGQPVTYKPTAGGDVIEVGL